MWLASHTLLISASYRPVARIKWGSVFACINLLLCVFILAWKLSFMSSGDASTPFICNNDAAAGSGSLNDFTQACHFRGADFPQPPAASAEATTWEPVSAQQNTAQHDKASGATSQVTTIDATGSADATSILLTSSPRALWAAQSRVEFERQRQRLQFWGYHIIVH